MSNPNTAVAKTVSDMLVKNKAKIADALPKGFNYGRMVKIVSNAVSTTPKLMECTPLSIFMACVQGACMGIEPNGPLAHGYLVPFNNKKKINGKDTWVHEAKFMPSYRGLINLARFSGSVSSIYAEVIRENDEYEIKRGTENTLHHPIKLGDRGNAIAYYAVMVDKDGNVDFEVMELNDIEHIRAKSKAKDFGPWKTDYDEMAKKTVLKRLLKRSPMSIEDQALSKAINADHKASMGDDDVIDFDIDLKDVEMPKTLSPPIECKSEIDLKPSQMDTPNNG